MRIRASKHYSTRQHDLEPRSPEWSRLAEAAHLADRYVSQSSRPAMAESAPLPAPPPKVWPPPFRLGKAVRLRRPMRLQPKTCLHQAKVF